MQLILCCHLLPWLLKSFWISKFFMWKLVNLFPWEALKLMEILFEMFEFDWTTFYLEDIAVARFTPTAHFTPSPPTMPVISHCRSVDVIRALLRSISCGMRPPANGTCLVGGVLANRADRLCVSSEVFRALVGDRLRWQGQRQGTLFCVVACQVWVTVRVLGDELVEFWPIEMLCNSIKDTYARIHTTCPKYGIASPNEILRM